MCRTVNADTIPTLVAGYSILKFLFFLGFSVGAVVAALILAAWLPAAPAALRHYVRHWGSVRSFGCSRCTVDAQREAAYGLAGQAFASTSARSLFRIAVGRAGAL